MLFAIYCVGLSVLCVVLFDCVLHRCMVNRVCVCLFALGCVMAYGLCVLCVCVFFCFVVVVSARCLMRVCGLFVVYRVWFCVFSLIVCCSAFVCFVCDLLCDVVWLVFDSLCV